jgi:hypothetical protein
VVVADHSRARLPLLVFGFLTVRGIAVGGSRARLSMLNKCLNRTGCWVCLFRGCAVVVASSRARLPVLAVPPRGSVGSVSWWDCGKRK